MFVGNFKVRYLKGTKQITLLRNILASLVYESRGISLENCLVLYDLLPQLIEKSEKDQQFNVKFGGKLIISYEIIKNNLNPTHFPYKPKKDLVKKIQDDLYGFIPSEQAYFGWSKNPLRRKSYEVLPDSLKLRLPKIKERSRIGVGYRDKGFLKDPAKDGSPSWKETGSYYGNIERQYQEDPMDTEIEVQTRFGKTKTAEQILNMFRKSKPER